MRETKRVGGHVTETKIKTVNGVEVGEISGYIAAWSADRGYIPDRFIRGAFAQSIQEHRARGNRQVRFKDHHGRTVGGFPIEGVYEDEVGLFGRGEINLEVQQGREAFSLARQGVLVDFSVGFIAQDKEMVDGIRVIERAELLEGSIVDEPMNVDAQIVEVKSMALELPVAGTDHPWREDEAERRVCDMSFGEMKGLSPYVGGYLVVDVIDGELRIVPEAVQVAAQELKAKADAPREHVQLVERLLAKAELPNPFDEEQRQFFGVGDVKDWTVRDLENALTRGACLSKGAAKLTIKNLTSSYGEEEEENGNDDEKSELEKLLADMMRFNSEMNA